MQPKFKLTALLLAWALVVTACFQVPLDATEASNELSLASMSQFGSE